MLSKNIYIFLLLCLFLISVSVSRHAFLKPHLTVAFLDVGQGDAIFIQAPNGNQVLFDGGPNRKVLQELHTVMPFYDRTIDMIVVTNPDKDHIGGFLDVLDLYEVASVLEPGTVSDTETYKQFQRMTDAEKAKKIPAVKGTKFFLDKDIFIEILFPDRDVSDWKKNDGSVVAKLVHGKNSFLLTGDAPAGTEKYLLSLGTDALNADVLKVGHHGSRTSTSEAFVRYVSPGFAVISYGEGNSYGHPHQEVLDNLKKYNVTVWETAKLGNILLYSDGEKIWK